MVVGLFKYALRRSVARCWPEFWQAMRCDVRSGLGFVATCRPRVIRPGCVVPPHLPAVRPPRHHRRRLVIHFGSRAQITQTDSFDLGHEPTHPPTLFQVGSASASPTSQRLTGITSAHHGYGKSTTPHPLSPGDPLRLSCSVGTLGVWMCITERLEVDVGVEPPVQLGISLFSCRPRHS